MMRFSVSLAQLDPRYLICFLQTPMAKQHILSRAKHSINQSSINQEDVKCLSVPLPPLSLQKEFAKRVAEIRELENGQAAIRRRLEDLYQSLLHRAFNGEL
jgi:type I restriction enzyme S subunit